MSLYNDMFLREILYSCISVILRTKILVKINLEWINGRNLLVKFYLFTLLENLFSPNSL